MAKYVRANDGELKFAYRLLTKLHANVNNTYLLLAIIAWARANNKVSQVRWSSTAAINRAVAATAAALSKSGYGMVLKILRRRDGDKDAATQAVDFMIAIAESKWDSKHYGAAVFGQPERPGQPIVIKSYDIYKSTLYKGWTSLLGHKITLPADVLPIPKPPPQPKPPKPPPAPHQPRSLRHTIAEREYLQPYAAESFYEGRHRSPDALVGDPRATGV